MSNFFVYTDIGLFKREIFKNFLAFFTLPTKKTKPRGGGVKGWQLRKIDLFFLFSLIIRSVDDGFARGQALMA